MPRHCHVSMEELQRQIRESIGFQGFAIRNVLSSNNHPEFTYTVGLHLPGSERPELFISGLSRAARVQWILHLGFLIQGPPPLEGYMRKARQQGISVKDFRFPPGGKVFKSGVCYRDLAEGDFPTCFGEVERRYYHHHFGQAIVFHGTHNFPVLQVVWSDTKGHFPWDPQFEARFRGQQRLLFSPQRYLPLKQAEQNEP